MKSLTQVVPVPRGQEKCKKTPERPPLIDTEAIMASTNHSPFFEKGARGIRFRSQSSQPPSPRRSVPANIIDQNLIDIPLARKLVLKGSQVLIHMLYVSNDFSHTLDYNHINQV